MDETVEKLSFDSTDFKFIAAYGKYSEKFDEADDERREVLNAAISQLHSEEISYPEFYETIGRKGGETTKKRHGPKFYERIGRKGGQRVRQLVQQAKRAQRG